MKKLVLSIMALVVAAFSVCAQDMPTRQGKQLVNDFSGLLSEADVAALEASLGQIVEKAQVAVVTVDDLQGMDVNAFAEKLGTTWGVGDPEKDNGAVLLIKNKTADSAGALSIFAGRGLDEILPEETRQNIINNDLIPAFKEGNYADGIKAAVGSIAKVFVAKEAAAAAQAAAEAVAAPAAEKGGIPTWVWIVLGLVVVGGIAFFVMKKK